MSSLGDHDGDVDAIGDGNAGERISTNSIGAVEETECDHDVFHNMRFLRNRQVEETEIDEHADPGKSLAFQQSFKLMHDHT